MSHYEAEELTKDPVADLEEDIFSNHEELAGCFRIPRTPFSLCWKLRGGKIEICLKLGPLTLACGTIDPRNPCVTLSGSTPLAKASVEICLKGKCLTYDAKACVRPHPFADWKCARVRGNIICFA